MWNNTTLKNSTAYVQVYNWLVGATMTRQCAGDSSNTWTCPITRVNGYQGLAVWNTVGTVSYTVPSGMIRYRDLSGNVVATTAGARINIGTSPILLEN